jgi:hypothetical protein
MHKKKSKKIEKLKELIKLRLHPAQLNEPAYLLNLADRIVKSAKTNLLKQF